MNFRAEVGGKNYRVATFPNLAYYGGSTTTTYTSDGKEQEYKAEEPMYMISVNAEAGTAEMTIYNAQFASNMPKIAAINVKGLKIQGDRSHGYKISGQNIVPTVGVGSAATAMPEFTFNNIEVYPSDNDLTSVQINFTAASRFKAIFTGSYDIAIK